MGTVSTQHYKIFDYWKDRSITSSGEVVKGGLQGECVIIDWAEPNCWACGRRAIRDAKGEGALQEKCESENGEFDFQQMWNDSRVKSALNRCHIVPAALGGKDEPPNLFLLCEECHMLSPDTTNPANFFRWVYKRKHDCYDGKMSAGKLFSELQSEFERRGVDLINCLRDIGIDFNYSTLNDYLSKHIGLHASALSDSSFICGVSDWILNQWTNAILNK